MLNTFCVRTRRTGGPVDVKVLVTTKDDPDRLMAKGRLHPKLFYALQLPIRLPSLRERPEDIPLLLDHFLRKFREASGRPDLRFTPEAVEYVVEAPLPGNVRQLRSLVSMAVGSVEHNAITAGDLAPLLKRGRCRCDAHFAWPTPC